MRPVINKIKELIEWVRDIFNFGYPEPDDEEEEVEKHGRA
jgi:hypothetical protein